MQVLNNEIIDQSMPLSALIVLIALITVAMFLLFENKLISLIGIMIFDTVFLVVFLNFKEDVWEYQDVIVTDWNVVHEEGWEVVSTHGDLVSLKRKVK